MSVIDEIKKKIEQAEFEKLSANCQVYREVLLQLQDGATVEPGKVKAALDALGKPFSDLELDLARMRSRFSARAKQQAVEESKQKLPAVEGELEKLKAERQKAIDKFNQQIEVVSAEKARLLGIVRDGESAARVLREACTNPALKLELVTLEEQIKSLREELGKDEFFVYRHNQGEVTESLKSRQDELRRLNAMREDVYRRMELD